VCAFLAAIISLTPGAAAVEGVVKTPLGGSLHALSREQLL
jgi:hypothetical protein